MIFDKDVKILMKISKRAFFIDMFSIAKNGSSRTSRSFLVTFRSLHSNLRTCTHSAIALRTTLAKSNKHKQNEASMPSLAGSRTIPVSEEVVQ